MGRLDEKLYRVVKSIEETTLSFYQNDVKEGYRRLDNTLQQLDTILEEVGLLRSQGAMFELDENEILMHLTEAMVALEQRDTSLLSDILCYEIKPLLEEGINGISL